MSKHKRLPDPADQWAEVELFRWQYGALPGPGDFRPLDPAAGLNGMADALLAGDHDNFPAPFNVAMVLKYASKNLRK